MSNYENQQKTVHPDAPQLEAATRETFPNSSPSQQPGGGNATEHKSRLSQCADYLKPARQLMLAWTSAVLAVLFLVLTTVYASQITVASRMRFLYSSSSNTIFVLSVLSGLAGLFLAATIAAAFEQLQWLLVVREDGLQYTRFLSLHAGTGVIGLLALAVGRGHPLQTTTRLWSAARLVSIILIPILGILIMSNVNTRMTFDVAGQTSHSFGWGMSPFNASLARNVSVVADQLLQAQLATFLYDPSHAVDITPSPLRSIPCANGPNSQSGRSCERMFFIPGGVEFAAPTVYNDDGHLRADAFLAKNQQGYLLDFREGDKGWQFDEAASCQVYGFAFAAFRLCLKNAANNTLDARIVNCPNEFSAHLHCLSNTSWHSDPGWTTSLTTYFRRATVAYSKSNGTILSHAFSDASAVPAPVSAMDMLQGYRDAFGDFSRLQDMLALLADPSGANLFPLYVYPAFVWACLKGVSSLGPQNPAVIIRAADALQCLLAIMLYYCQPSLFARALSKSAGNSTAGDENLRAFTSDMLRIAPPDTQISFAELRYRIVVGQATLIAYVILSGIALLPCLGILLFSSCSPFASKVPTTSSFPIWDFNVHCKVECDPSKVSTVKELEGPKLVRAAASMTIKRN